MKLFSTILLCFCFIGTVCAQSNDELHTESRRAKKYFKQALLHIDERRDDLAIAVIQDAIDEDADFIEAHLLLADLQKYNRNYLEFEKALREIVRIDPGGFPHLYYQMAKIAAEVRGDYQQGLEDIENYEFYISAEDREKDYFYLKQNIVFSAEAIKNPMDFNPVNIGGNVNTQFNDYWPSLTADEQVIVTTIQMPKFPNADIDDPMATQEDLFISVKDRNGKWQSREYMGQEFNSEKNEGAQCISSDGKYCVYTVCNRPDGYGSCDLYISYKRGRKWLKPRNMGPKVNSGKWESKASLSADGRYMYFARGVQEKTGFGVVDREMDIWCVEMKNGRVSGEPYKIEGAVNTDLNELSPFIHPDGKTLYFSSTGHPGFGGYDFFMSRKGKDGKWGEPVNLGSPINTNKNEIGLIVNAKGNIAMYASGREGGFGGMDIYSFNLPSNLSPSLVTYVKGKVYDIETNQPLKANCKLLDLENGDLAADIVSDDVDGNFLVCLPSGFDYAFNVAKEGYLFYSENFSLVNIEQDKVFYMDIPLQPIKEGKTVVLKNIFFEFDDFKLKNESYVELEKLLQFMKLNADISIEISGHTDNIGTAQYNKTLSQNRAESVYNYLIENGIQAERLSYQGYGFDVPIADNNTDEGRALNRRTEFKVVKVK